MTDVSPGDPPESLGATVGFLLSQLGADSARRFQEALAPLGLEPRHFAILRFAAGAEGQSQQALGEALEIAPSRMVTLIDELEDRGLIERRSNPTDRRARALYLTAAGHQALAASMERGLAHEAQVCAALTPAEREELIALLGRIAAAQGLTAGVHPGLRSGV